MIHHRTKRIVKPWPKPNYGHAARHRRLRDLLAMVALIWFSMLMLALIWFGSTPAGR